MTPAGIPAGLPGTALCEKLFLTQGAPTSDPQSGAAGGEVGYDSALYARPAAHPNCPVCGMPLRFVKNDDSTGVTVALYHCPMHGVYYFDQNGLTPGTPPPR